YELRPQLSLSRQLKRGQVEGRLEPSAIFPFAENCRVIDRGRRCGLRSSPQKVLEVLAAGHLRVRRRKAVSKFALADERARHGKSIFQIGRTAQRDVEKS